jgi:hypothetical protein
MAAAIIIPNLSMPWPQLRYLVVRICNRMVSQNCNAAPDEQGAITSQNRARPTPVSCPLFGRWGLQNRGPWRSKHASGSLRISVHASSSIPPCLGAVGDQSGKARAVFFASAGMSPRSQNGATDTSKSLRNGRPLRLACVPISRTVMAQTANRK